MTHQTMTYNNSSNQSLPLAFAAGRNAEVRRVFLLFLLMMVIGVGSAWGQSASVWDGSTKYTTLADADIDGKGTEAAPYIIDDANKFVAFGSLANNSTAYWKLEADIDLGGYPWPYAGAAPKTFKGHFDGQNHTVSNYTITPVTKTANGLFGTITGSSATNRAEIKDLKIDNVTISTTGDLEKTTYIGALVGNASQYVDFKNVQIIDADNNDKTVSITLDNLIGDCNIGGLIGSLQKNSTMEDCTVNKPVVLVQGEGAVAGTCYIGGAIGYVTGSSATEVTKIDKPTSGSTNGLTVNNPSVTVHKILSSWYIGSSIGRINNYSDVNYVTVANPTLIYKAVGSPNNGLYLGTLTGNIQGNGGSATADPISTPVKNISITGTSQITIGTGSEEIKNVWAGVVGLINTNVDIATWNVATSNITVNGSLTTSADYFGGVIGQVKSNQSAASTDTQTAIDDVTLGSSTITVTGNVVKESYIGSIFGRIEGHNGNDTNRPKRTVVTDVTTTGITKVVFGSSLSPVSVANARSGAIGFLGVNAEMTGCTIANTQIEVNGTLDTGASYLGGVVGYVQSSNTAFEGVLENGIATKVDDITITNSDVKITGNVTIKESSVGSAFGILEGNVGTATVAPQHVLASNITASTMAVTFGTNETPVDVTAVKAGFAGYVKNYVTIDTWNITTSNVTLNGTIATTGGYLGGVIGHVSSAKSVVAGTDFTNITTVALGTSTISITGNITKDSHIGSIFGRVEGFAGDATNYPKRTTVTGVTTTGITKVVFGSNSNNVNVAGVRAGAIGSAATNAEITHSTLADTQIELNGNFVTSAGYLGGIVGQVQSSTTAFPGILQDAIGTKIDDITVKNSNVNVTGNVAKDLNVGGGFGRFEGATSTTVAWQATEVTNIKFKNSGNGTSSVTIGTNNTNTINYIRAGIAGMAYQNAIIDEWDIEKASVVVNGKLQTTSSYVGGCIGHVQSVNDGPVTMSDMQITVSDVVAINGDIEKDTYIGGAFGRMDQNNGANNTAPTAENIKITGLDMSFGGDFKLHVYAGGIVGYLAAVNYTVTNLSSVINCSVSGQIRSSASKTFVQDRTYAFGGIVGYNNQNATTNRSEIKQCISEVDINLGGCTPSTLAAGLSNLYKNGFAVGGVIGRIDNPSLLPEHLYYSGKIYAPFAAVGPIVGTFQKSLASSATYIYEDYSGEYAAPTLSAQEWEKANTWYYNDYKLGLSNAVITQTARTKNYTDPTTTIDGVKYLTITDATFQNCNAINGAKISRTVLRYTVNNKDVNMGIFPNWTTNSVTYPEYYMYYMQGVNRGVYQPNVEYAKELIKKQLMVLPKINTEQSGDDYTFTISVGDVEDDTDFTVSYQWYQNDGTTAIGGATSNSITLTEDVMDSYGGAIYCKITVSGTNFTQDVFYTLRGSIAIVVFVDGASGIDNNPGSTARGWTPETAVKTINHANSLLKSEADGGKREKNIIVVIGTLNSDGDFRSDGKNPATITGKYDGKDYMGIIKLKQINQSAGENALNLIGQPGQKGSNCYVQADTKFEYLTFQANDNGAGNNFIECHGNDVWFGKGLVMTNFCNLSKNHGNLEAAQNIPELTIVLTATNLNEETIQKYTNREKPQVVTIESGRYGRIMGGRYTNGFFAAGTNTSHTILGSAEHPIWAIVNVDIEKNSPNEGTINRKEAPNTGTVTNAFTCDINCIIAGLTDGTMYGDYEINVHGGRICYIVGGNQGNPVPNGSKTFTQPGGKSGNWGQWPNSSYLGRTVINVEQDDELKDIVIDNLYAGGLGREANGEAATSIVDMYMYGHTEINMKSGTITGNIYGGGAGGVIGLNPWDMHVPYATNEAENATNAIMNGVQYGEWGAKKAGDALASVTLHNLNDDGVTYTAEPLNLANSSTTLNVYGGTINGSVYGGGCGYVSNMPEKVVMQGVGSVFGTSNVNISGGTIHGSVYGGSEGSDKYYGATNKYNQTITNIAEMNGTVNMTITGTNSQYPTIDGSIYGAGKGIAYGYNSTTKKNEEYLRIATAGNSDLGDEYKTDINITIDMPESVEFPNDIYGGGALGKVDGNTNVVLKRGKFTGSIYGGGYGELQHLDKAMVMGNTNIYTGAVNKGDVNPAKPVTIQGGSAIYGGGNMAQVTGNTYINLYHGNITANVFGGGKGLTQSLSGAFTDYGKVTGNTRVLYNNTTENNKLTGNIYGGGALGAVDGQGDGDDKGTTVVIKAGEIIGDVFGGGRGETGSEKAKVTGNTNVIVDSNWKESTTEPESEP